MGSDGTVGAWLVWGALLLVALVVAVMLVRATSRSRAARRFAKREGFAWLGDVDPLPLAWRDLACFRMARRGRAIHCVAGERHGRAFAIVEYHYGSDGPEMRSNPSLVLVHPALWLFTWILGRTHDPGFSAAVVECELPSRRFVVGAERDLAPWRVEFGEDASVIRRNDGFASPAELVEAVDRLNGVLDELFAAPNV